MPRAPSSAASIALPAAPHQNLRYRRALARLRKQAEDEIERLLDFLDKVSPDPDLEDDDGCEDGWDLEDDGSEEPNLGASETQVSAPLWQMAGAGPLVPTGVPVNSQLAWGSGHLNTSDLEEDITDEPHDAGFEGNDEPSLGWPDGREDQTRSALGTDDLEDEHDGCEPEHDGAVDDEPCDDLEEDHDFAASSGDLAPCIFAV